MSWKAAIFHIQNAIKTTFMNGVTWNLVHAIEPQTQAYYFTLFYTAVYTEQQKHFDPSSGTR